MDRMLSSLSDGQGDFSGSKDNYGCKEVGCFNPNSSKHFPDEHMVSVSSFRMFIL